MNIPNQETIEALNSECTDEIYTSADDLFNDIFDDECNEQN